MFEISENDKNKAKLRAIKQKEKFIYQLALDLAINPETISLENNIIIPDESDPLYGHHVVLSNAIIDLKNLKS